MSKGRSSGGPAVYVPKLDDWAACWMIDPQDRPVGEAICAVFAPFIQHLIDQGLARRTLQRHVDNLWLLGGEIIAGINRDDSLRKESAAALVINAIHEEGGPLLRESEAQRAFDVTCRTLHRFLASWEKG